MAAKRKNTKMWSRTTALKEVLDELSPEERARVRSRAAALLSEELIFCQLQEAFKLTRDQLADKLEAAQAKISKFETQNDLKVSTVDAYVEALGGKLRVTAELHGRQDRYAEMEGIEPLKTNRFGLKTLTVSRLTYAAWSRREG